MPNDRDQRSQAADAIGPWLELGQEMQRRGFELTSDIARAQMEQMMRFSEQWLDVWRAQIGATAATGERMGADQPSPLFSAFFEAYRRSWQQWSDGMNDLAERLRPEVATLTPAGAPTALKATDAPVRRTASAA